MKEVKDKKNSDISEVPEDIDDGIAIVDEFDEPEKSFDNIKKISDSESDIPNNRKSSFLNIPTGVLEKLPDDFNINDIGNIDLKEAEAIASEDILFLTEDDLIEGLEEFELIPLKDEEVEKSINTSSIIKEKVKSVSEEVVKVEVEKIDSSETDKSTVVEPDIEEKNRGEDADSERDKKTVVNKDEKADAIIDDKSSGAEDLLSDFEPISKEIAEEMTTIVVDEIEENLDKNETELPGIIDVNEDGKDVKITEDKGDFEDGVVVHVEKESLPDNLQELNSYNKDVLFVDDEFIEKEIMEINRVFHEDTLDEISSGIIEIVEGSSRNIEVDPEEEDLREFKEHASSAFDDMIFEFDTHEYKYKDDELDFIHSEIVAEDYAKYIREIDDLFGYDGKKKVSVAFEIFGLDSDEIKTIEERLFSEEYKDVDFDEIFNILKSEIFGKGSLKSAVDKICSYLIPEKDGITETEKKSIEEDVSAGRALIFEEDVQLIKNLYNGVVEPVVVNQESESESESTIEDSENIEQIDESDKKNEESFDLSEEDELPDIDVLSDRDLKISHIELAENGDSEGEIDVLDITDSVVIIENEKDVDRFMEKIPENRQEDTRKLLKYLDGLFEKLPEAAIENFAKSEYFDLYSKLLKDMEK